MSAAATRRSPRRGRILAVTIAAAIGLGGFSALAIWQVQRLHWKRDLIERVDARVHADPVAAPGPQDWPGLTRENAEYRHVSVTGSYLPDADIPIYVPSDWGPAYWILTPLRREDGSIVMINRGMAPETELETLPPAPSGEVTVTGLLRISEDEGWLFSQENRPDEQKWYRRDIGSITATLGYDPAAPYFIDADLVDPEAWPRAGMTVIQFRNAHLSYALTWGALALLVIGGYGLFLRQELRPRD
ncbi:SURF1 family protein [Mangrovicoccus algicola]|uniref:SURF1-like protein n=1 Tax=Mangrovicoccus algicola TaxID=2771008 RepID=A0A8J6YYT3_9RHOB|nr:SURF1 family protein [Mangrovicoccus algicola]MBE3638526.1 SURF1 family protein [Mangrovicoccus algicola]